MLKGNELLNSNNSPNKLNAANVFQDIKFAKVTRLK